MKKKQQQSTSNCEHNANTMPPGQQEGLCESFLCAPGGQLKIN